jgi:hypothetical protein
VANDLLNANLSPVSWTIGTGSRGTGQESAEQKNGKGQKIATGLKPNPAEPAEAVELDEHEIDSFA